MYWCTVYKLVLTDCNLLTTGSKIDEYVEIIIKHTTNVSFDVAHDSWNARDPYVYNKRKTHFGNC